MRVDPLWAGQYLLVDELWRDKERIIYDPLLCELLVDPKSEGLWWDNEMRVQGLLQSLLAQDHAPVWLLFDQLRDVQAAGLDPAAFGARSVLQSLDIARKGDWSVALLDLSEHLDEIGEEMSGGPRGPRPSSSALAALLEELRSKLDAPRSLVLWCRADHGDPMRSRRLARLRELARPVSSALTKQLLGLSPAPVLQVFPLGKVQAGSGSVSGEAAEEELELEVDNRLGSQHPEFGYYMCVIGARLSAGITMIELPAAAHGLEAASPVATEVEAEPTPPPPPLVVDEAGASILQQRVETLEAELKSSEEGRLALLRDLDHATQQIAELEDELDDLRDPGGAMSTSLSSSARDFAAAPAEMVGEGGEDGARPVGPSRSVQAAESLQAAWELEQLRAQVAALRARPVEALEAENALLRAMLSERGTPVLQDPKAWSSASRELDASAADLGGTELGGAEPVAQASGEERARIEAPLEYSRPRFFDRFIHWSAAGRPATFVPSAQHPRSPSGGTEAEFKKLSRQLQRLRSCLEGGGLLPLALRKELLQIEGNLQRFVGRRG